MKLRYLLFATIVISLVGCATGIAESQKTDTAAAWRATLPESGADYGGYPEDYQEKIRFYFEVNLKDPESAKYTGFSVPRKEHMIANNTAVYGYSACVFVNAKNSFGGYTGKRRYWFFFRNGEMLRSKDTSTTFGQNIYIGRSIDCRDGRR